MVNTFVKEINEIEAFCTMILLFFFFKNGDLKHSTLNIYKKTFIQISNLRTLIQITLFFYHYIQ